jgi:hypothetical protein
MKRFFIICLLFLTTSSARGSWEEKWHEDKLLPKKPEPLLYSDSDFWANLWMGYSFCSLEAVRKSTNDWNYYLGTYGTASAQPDLDGLNLGLEGGWLFDGLNGLSLSVENIQVSQTSYNFSTPSTSILADIQPGVYGFSANYCHFIDQTPNAQTYIAIGAGYYLGTASYAQYRYSNGLLTQSDQGRWEGGGFGGTLGAGARINAGKRFGIQLDARGRYANIPKVTTAYTDPKTKNNYVSVLAVNPNGIVLQEPQDNLGNNGNLDQPLDFDFSGFDINIGIFYHF